MNQDHVLPHGVTLFALGLGVLVVTLLSIAQPDVGLARSQWSALMALVLAAPVLVAYAYRGGVLGVWTRDFWSAALVAYLLHFWWAVFGTFRGDFGAIVAHQGFVAYSNFLVTVLWLADVALCWSVAATAGWMRWLQVVNRWLVFISFTAAGVIFRGGTVRLVGAMMVVAVLVALFARYTTPRLKPKQEELPEATAVPEASEA